MIPDEIIAEFNNLAESAAQGGRLDWPMRKLLDIIEVQDAELDELRRRVEALEQQVG